ncbi:MAG: GNAT family N-acetyltransferase [Aeromicrobium erythreum]
MPDLVLADTDQLGEVLLGDVRALLHDAFDGDFDADDWAHCLGGRHALVLDGGRVLAHGSVVPRTLTTSGRRLRAGYVEGVAVAAAVRRRGLGAQVMTALETVVLTTYDVGALGTSDDGLPLYTAHGWVPWRGPLLVESTQGRRRTPDDEGGVLVRSGALDLADLDLDAELVCDDRSGDVW